MKYFVAESVKKENKALTPQQIEQDIFPKHVTHVREGIASGMILLAGPCETGGFQILRAETREEAETFLESDPIRRNGLTDFTLKEFDLKDRAEMVKDW